MSRPEGLCVPTVEPDDIVAAMYDLESRPFLQFREKQRHLRGWILRQIEKQTLRVALTGQTYPEAAMQYEAVIAYEAMQYAFHKRYERDLPRVDFGTIIAYHQELCPGSRLNPVTHEPLEPVAPDVGADVRREFVGQQIYMASMFGMRFGDTETMRSGVLFAGMAHNMINNQLAQPSKT